MSSREHKTALHPNHPVNNRVLVIDDELRVINTYLEMFEARRRRSSYLKELLQANAEQDEVLIDFEVTTADQGEAGAALVQQALEQDTPYAVAFIDMRMPPGWDGLETAKRIRELDDNIYIVFVTSDSNYSIDELQLAMVKNILMLDKPFRCDILIQIARTFCISWMRERNLVEARAEMDRLSEALFVQANHDALTGLHNRYYLDQHLSIELKRSAREQKPLGVLMIDIDWFKRYNDGFGHIAGDQALKDIAHAIQHETHRAADVVARYGGEEFCVVLPGTDDAGVRTVAESIRQKVESLELEFTSPDCSSPGYLTVSIGGVSKIPEEGKNDATLIDLADRQLYLAKEGGKNCVNIHSSGVATEPGQRS